MIDTGSFSEKATVTTGTTDATGAFGASTCTTIGCESNGVADGSAFWLTWRADGRQLLYADAVDGGSGIAEGDSVRRTVRRLWKGPETLRAAASFARTSVRSAVLPAMPEP